MSRVGKYCEDRKKPLIMEDIDTTISKHGMKYGSKKGNRHASVFAYRKMESCIENQSYRRNHQNKLCVYESDRKNPVYEKTWDFNT